MFFDGINITQNEIKDSLENEKSDHMTQNNRSGSLRGRSHVRDGTFCCIVPLLENHEHRKCPHIKERIFYFPLIPSGTPTT